MSQKKNNHEKTEEDDNAILKNLFEERGYDTINNQSQRPFDIFNIFDRILKSIQNIMSSISSGIKSILKKTQGEKTYADLLEPKKEPENSNSVKVYDNSTPLEEIDRDTTNYMMTIEGEKKEVNAHHFFNPENGFHAGKENQETNNIINISSMQKNSTQRKPLKPLRSKKWN